MQYQYIIGQTPLDEEEKLGLILVLLLVLIWTSGNKKIS